MYQKSFIFCEESIFVKSLARAPHKPRFEKWRKIFFCHVGSYSNAHQKNFNFWFSIKIDEFRTQKRINYFKNWQLKYCFIEIFSKIINFFFNEILYEQLFEVIDFFLVQKSTIFMENSKLKKSFTCVHFFAVWISRRSDSQCEFHTCFEIWNFNLWMSKNSEIQIWEIKSEQNIRFIKSMILYQNVKSLLVILPNFHHHAISRVFIDRLSGLWNKKIVNYSWKFDTRVSKRSKFTNHPVIDCFQFWKKKITLEIFHVPILFETSEKHNYSSSTEGPAAGADFLGFSKIDKLFMNNFFYKMDFWKKNNAGDSHYSDFTVKWQNQTDIKGRLRLQTIPFQSEYGHPHA